MPVPRFVQSAVLAAVGLVERDDVVLEGERGDVVDVDCVVLVVVVLLVGD